VAHKKKLNVASVRLFAEALQADPNLGAERRAQHRYNAACLAALVATGPETTPSLPSPISAGAKTKNSSPSRQRIQVGGADMPLTDAERAKLRNQARAWLEAELTTWSKLLGTADGEQRRAIATTLKNWQRDTDLAGVRAEAALAKLPEKERNEWRSLWANVNALLKKASES
jgi:hypothetical protein